MRLRRLLLGAGALALLGAVAAWTWLLVPRPGVTRANYERIRKGMTFEEVEAIFGGPPTNGAIPKRREELTAFDFYMTGARWAAETPTWDNVQEGVRIWVAFDDRRVSAKECRTFPAQRDRWRSLRRLLPW